MLGLSTVGQRAAAALAYVLPTPLCGQDVWACAQTGSGKTAALALPPVERCVAADPEAALKVLVLVLVPTRELAAQIGAACVAYAQFAPQLMKIVTAFGDVSMNPQMMALRGGADILVATSGRLLDLVEHHAVQLGRVSTLVPYAFLSVTLALLLRLSITPLENCFLAPE